MAWLAGDHFKQSPRALQLAVQVVVFRCYCCLFAVQRMPLNVPAGASCCTQAWLRARGDAGLKTFTTDDVIDSYGVVKGT